MTKMKADKIQYDNLNDLANQAMEIVKQNGWDVIKESDWEDTYKIPALLALIGSEVSEALEAFRKNDKENFKEEMTDILIRAVDMASIFDPDIEQTIANKMAKNKSRGYKHGGKRL